jgi:3-oxoadipate enol-lactonase / 4-carboxymuconolactone decarboxylase
VTLSWRSEGPADAAPLVLLNSVGSTTEMWTPVLAPLVEQYRVIRIDTRGHGDSPPAPPGTPGAIADLAADVLATLDDIGLDRTALAGLSLGGMVGMWIAAHRPARVSRLAVLCSSAYVPTGALYVERAAAVRASGMAPIAEAVVARWLTPGLAERDPALVDMLRTMVVSVDAESYAQCCAAIAALDLRPDLARIAAPTLVIGAADDPALPPPQQEEIAAGIVSSRLEIIDDAAHLATVEQPARVAALLLDHFRGGGTATAGYRVRRDVLGDRYVDAALAARTDLTAGFQDFLTRYAWGEVWSGPGLSRRDRSIVTVSALVTIGAEHELAAHIRGAVRNGLSPAEILGILQHLAIYAGMPRANKAVAIAADVLADLDPGKDDT